MQTIRRLSQPPKGSSSHDSIESPKHFQSIEDFQLSSNQIMVPVIRPRDPYMLRSRFQRSVSEQQYSKTKTYLGKESWVTQSRTVENEIKNPGYKSTTEWSLLLRYLTYNSYFIHSLSSRAEHYSASDHIDIAELLDRLAEQEERIIGEYKLSLHVCSCTPEAGSLIVKENEEAFYNLLLESAAIIKVCNVFNLSVGSQTTRKGGLSLLGSHMSSFIDPLVKDVNECLVDAKYYYSKRLAYRIAKAPNYKAQACLWRFKFESHRKIFQTALALYLSLSAVSVDSVNRLSFAFSLFPQLDPLGEDNQSTTFIDYDSVLLSAPHTQAAAATTENDRASTQSSYATARETMNSVSTSSISLSQHDTVYSVASSRTAETDYGLYYRRMALSQISGDSTGGWITLSWGPDLLSESGEELSITANSG